MMNVSTLMVLLVCVMAECAHAASYQWGWERLQSRSKRSTRDGSVVENWNSVCEEVCGAGYGGLGCEDHCFPVQYVLANSFIDVTLGNMCSILCENRLGSAKCGCPSVIGVLDYNKSIVDKNRDRDRLCSEACKWRFHLKGCSSCSIAADDTTTDSEIINKDSRSDSDSSESNSSNDNENTSEEDRSEQDRSEEDTSEEDSSEEETTTDESTTEEATTEATTPTTTQPTTTRTTTPATTTPDWVQLCETLCRNGEGGSLCNCDIPPFF